MPFIPLILGLIASTSLGAFVGSQIDDSVENTRPTTFDTSEPSMNKILFYSAVGLTLFIVAKKAGVFKALS